MYCFNLYINLIERIFYTMFKYVFFLLILAVNFAFSQTASFTGKVFDKNTDVTISDINVNILNTSFSTKTNKTGEFFFYNLRPGDYKVEFIHPGYKTLTADFRIISHITSTLDVKLNINEIETGEITVTSTRYANMLKDIPLPMEVVDEHQIIRSPANTVSDVLNSKPGLSLIRDGIWATDISIRGLSRSNIVTLIDGNRIETATDISARLSMIDLSDIDRIEIIKGGSSSLYGTGAFGGIVNIITKGGEFSNIKYFKGSLLSGFNTVNTSGVGRLFFNAGSKLWFAKLSGSMRNAKNTMTPQGELLNSQYSDNNLSGSIGFRPLRNHTFKFDYQRYYARDIGIPGSSLFPTNAIVTYPEEKREMYSAEYKFSEISQVLKNISAKYFYQTILRDVNNIPNQSALQKTPSGKLKQLVTVDKIVPVANHYTNGIQLQTDWALGKYNNVVVGADLWQRSLTSNREKFQTIYKYDTTSGNLLSTTNQITGEKPLPEAEYRSLGGYAQDEIKLLENKLKINLGVRIDRVKVTNSNTPNPAYTIVNGVLNTSPAGQKIIWNATEASDISWSSNIGAMYTIAKNIDITFNTARSFRSPSIEERFQYIDLGSYLRIGNPYLNPEQGLFADLGLRIWKPTYNFSGNIFMNSFKDLVAEIPGTYDNKPAFIKTNIGKAVLYGYEFDFMYNFYKSFVVYTSLSYVRGEDTENNLDLPQMPPLNGRLGIRGQVINYLMFDITSLFFNRQDKVYAGEVPTPGYATFNIGLSSTQLDIYKYVKLQLFAGVENLMDKDYRNHLSSNRGSVTVEPGRNLYFKMEIDF
jgi:hemoglobin/transferrin/lactoferrin receptor protein